MSDLYAINLHLQERLEREWREEVRAAEAAVRLDDAGLLRDYKRGLPLRTLLRAGRIAGQQQRPDRPDQSNGSWWIRRLAESRDAVEIQQAQRQMRRYLPIDRDILHAEWPLSRGNSTFWEELGRTVAAFGYLENELTSACYTLTAPPADFSDLQPDQVEAHLMVVRQGGGLPGRRHVRSDRAVRRTPAGRRKGSPYRPGRSARAARRAQDVAQCTVSWRMVRILRSGCRRLSLCAGASVSATDRGSRNHGLYCPLAHQRPPRTAARCVRHATPPRPSPTLS